MTNQYVNEAHRLEVNKNGKVLVESTLLSFSFLGLGQMKRRAFQCGSLLDSNRFLIVDSSEVQLQKQASKDGLLARAAWPVQGSLSASE